MENVCPNSGAAILEIFEIPILGHVDHGWETRDFRDRNVIGRERRISAEDPEKHMIDARLRHINRTPDRIKRCFKPAEEDFY